MKVLVIGHGLIGKKRAAALTGLEEGSLAGTVDPVVKSTLAAPHYESLGQVPTDSYDAAVVALPHDLAVEACEQVLAAGKPVLLEKPLGTNLSDAQRLVRAAEQVGMPCFVGYNYRFIPHVRQALLAAKQGTLGVLRSADIFLGHGGHPGSAKGWKLDPARAGGGGLIDPGVHLLDLLSWLEPELELAHVQATGGFWKTGIEEDLVAVLGHQRLLATVRVSLVRWVNTFRVELTGEDGYALAEGRGGNYGPLTLRLGKRWGWNDGSGRSQRETETVEQLGNDDPSLTDELASVLRLWQGKPLDDEGPPPARFADGLRVAQLVDAMYRELGS